MRTAAECMRGFWNERHGPNCDVIGLSERFTRTMQYRRSRMWDNLPAAVFS